MLFQITIFFFSYHVLVWISSTLFLLSCIKMKFPVLAWATIVFLSFIALVLLMYYKVIKTMHSHCMHIFSTIFYLCFQSFPSLASEFFLFIPSVFTPIYLCSALSSLISVRIAIFFHGIFPDHEVSGYPRSTLSLYSLANWRLPKLFPVLFALITAFRVLHLEWRRLLLRVSIFNDAVFSNS